MRIFNKSGGWNDKINFVDDNNVLLGYDMGQACCEHADWFIANEIKKQIIHRDELDEKIIDMPGWNFDPNFFKEIDDIDELYEGGMVIFRITNGEQEKFIHLFNCHNGYYSHGFNFQEGDKSLKEGYL